MSKSTPEEAPVKRPPNPSDPTLVEKEAHWACGHLPARPWCPVCVKGRGKNDPHYEKVKNNLELPTVSMDYYAEVGNEDDGQAGEKLLVRRERTGLVTRSAIWWSAKGLTKF